MAVIWGPPPCTTTGFHADGAQERHVCGEGGLELISRRRRDHGDRPAAGPERRDRHVLREL